MERCYNTLQVVDAFFHFLCDKLSLRLWVVVHNNVTLTTVVCAFSRAKSTQEKKDSVAKRVPDVKAHKKAASSLKQVSRCKDGHVACAGKHGFSNTTNTERSADTRLPVTLLSGELIQG